MILSPLLVVIEREWGLTTTTLGIISSLLYLAYIFCQLPAGYLADKLGQKKILAMGLFVQGLAVLGTGLSRDVRSFILFRFLTGIGQGTQFTSQFGLASRLIPKKKRALGVGIIHAGMSVGIIYGLMLASQITFRFNLYWGVSFILSGILTLIIFLILIITLKEPEKNNHEEEESTSAALPLKDVLLNKNLFFISMVGLFEAYVVFMLFSWLPYYLTLKGFSEAQAGSLSSLASLLTIPATVVLALYSDRIGSRKSLIMFFLPFTIFSLLVILFSNNLVLISLALLLNGLFGRMTIAPLHISLIADTVDAQNRSTALGFFNTFNSFSMFLAPSLTGFLADVTGFFEAGLYLAIFLQILAFVLFGLFVSENTEKLQEEGERSDARAKTNC